MVDLTIIGSGITSLLIARDFKGSYEIFEKEKYIEKLNSSASLWSIIPPLCGEYKQQCEDTISFYEKLGTELNIFNKRTYIITDKDIGGKEISEKELRELEPDLRLKGNLKKIENGFFIEGDELIKKMISNSRVNLGNKIAKLEVKDNEVKSIVNEKGEKYPVERLVIASGYWSKEFYPSLSVQPYKGHLIITTTSYRLNGILFYKGKIVVKGKEKLYINGDAINDPSLHINYDIVKDHLTAVSEILPLSDNIEIRVGIRSVSNDNKPILQQIYKNAVVVTGFRFGFALAPYLAEEVIKMISHM